MESLKNLPASDTLSKEEIEELLPCLDEIEKWAKEVQELALKRALAGEKFKGFKVVEGRSNRRFTDQLAVISTIEKSGIGVELFYKPKALVGVAEFEKILGKAKFKELIEPFVEKGEGAPALVPENDKRPEYSKSTAIADFMEEI